MPAADPEDTRDLAALNRALEASGALPPAAWAQWLWGSEPEEAFAPQVLLNRNQLLGLLVCRYKHRHAPPAASRPQERGRLSLMDKAPADMTWRELKDTLANVQIEWPAFLQRLDRNQQVDTNLLAVKALVDGCAERFGGLCERAWHISLPCSRCAHPRMSGVAVDDRTLPKAIHGAPLRAFFDCNDHLRASKDNRQLRQASASDGHDGKHRRAASEADWGVRHSRHRGQIRCHTPHPLASIPC